MQKWEYKCIEIYNTFDDTQAINKKLNELGALGWELVSFITQVESVKKEIGMTMTLIILIAKYLHQLD